MTFRDTSIDGATRLLAATLADTSAASASVVASRLMACAHPHALLSHRQQRENTRMVAEKVKAGVDGCIAAAAELAAMPYRMLQAGARPAALTPAGCIDAWMALGALWLGVGNAALQPARETVVANRARLQGSR